MTTLVIPARYNGPPSSANGGWSAGSLATLLDGAACVTVRLRRPPPLETRLDVTVTDGSATAALPDGGGVVLEATATEAAEHPGLAAVPRVGEGEAAAAASAYRGARDHPFPTCFTCGPERPPGDGLHLTPGILPDRPTDTACVWTPVAPADVPTVWAALDCPGGWSVDLAGRPMVLGTMTAVVHRIPDVGERCVVMGRQLDHVGRKAHTTTTLWSGDDVLAQATATWIAVDPAVFSA